MRAALDEEFPRAQRTWVIGVLRQKDAHEMLDALGVGELDRVICCRPEIPRAVIPRRSPTPPVRSVSIPRMSR